MKTNFNFKVLSNKRQKTKMQIKTFLRIRKNKRYFFESVNKVNKFLARLIRKPQ